MKTKQLKKTLLITAVVTAFFTKTSVYCLGPEDLYNFSNPTVVAVWAGGIIVLAVVAGSGFYGAETYIAQQRLARQVLPERNFPREMADHEALRRWAQNINWAERSPSPISSVSSGSTGGSIEVSSLSSGSTGGSVDSASVVATSPYNPGIDFFLSLSGPEQRLDFAVDLALQLLW